jgi:hypothetical protein
LGSEQPPSTAVLELLRLYGWIILVFVCVALLDSGGKAWERWDVYERRYAVHEDPPTLTRKVVGAGPDQLYALTSTPDFADTTHCQVLAYTAGVWTVHYATHTGPDGIDLALLADGRLALSRDDYSLVLIGPGGVTTIATPQVCGFVAPLGDNHVLIAGLYKVSTASARVNLTTGVVEHLDLLVSRPPVVWKDQVYLFDQGRYHMAIVGRTSTTVIPYSPTWRPGAFTVDAHGAVYAVITPRSGTQGAIWRYTTHWKHYAPLPDKAVSALIHDGRSLLIATARGVYCWVWAVGKWATDGVDTEGLRWRFYALTEGALLNEWFDGRLLLRRDYTWTALPSVPPYRDST